VNVMISMFFCFAHQGGIVPASFSISHTVPERGSVYWHATFMPPRAFASEGLSRQRWVDTGSSNPLPFLERACQHDVDTSSVFYASPVPVHQHQIACKTPSTLHGFHVDTDNLHSDQLHRIQLCHVDCTASFKQ
jgi:hypothetical protein